MTNDVRKTKAQLIEQINALRQRVAALEAGSLAQAPAADPRADQAAAPSSREGRHDGQPRPHRHVEQGLRESEEKFRTLAENAPVGIYLADNDGQCTYVNEKWCQAAGLRPEEAKGRGWIRGLHPEDRETIVSKWYEMAASGGEWGGEYRFVNADGEVTWVCGHASPLVDDQGRRTGYVGTNVDVTDRKRAEQALREREEHFQALFERAPLAYQSLDEEGNIIEVNEQWLAVMGYAREEIVGRSFADFILREQKDLFPGKFAGFKETGFVHNVEWSLVRRDGTVIDTLFDGRIERDAAGRFRFTRCIFRDVTEQRRIEEALRESERRYREVIDNMATAVVVYEVRGEGEDFVFRDVNPATARIGERTREEHLGKSVQEVYPGVREMGLFEVFRRVYQTGEPERFPLTRYHDGRVELWVDNYVFKLGSGEIVAVYEDSSERRRAQEALDRELRLHAALAELSTAILSEGLSIADVARLVLARARELTGSAHGYVSTMDPKTRDMISHTLTQMMDGCPVPDSDKRITFSQGSDGKFPGLWGHSLNTGKPFYTNAPQAHETAGGTPEGHLPLDNFLSVPAVIGGRILGQIALANCEGGYDDRDLEAIERLAALYAVLLRRREIEDELQRAKALLSAAIEQTPAGIVIADAPDVRMQIINSAALAIRGTTRDQLTGIPWELAAEWWQMFRPDGTPLAADELPLSRAVRNGETIENVEIVVRRPDGEKRWILANAAPVRNEQGQIIAGVAVFPDITERKREEEEMKRLAAAVEQSAGAIIITNRRGDVEYVNPAFEVFSGFSRREAIGKKPYDLLHSDRYGKVFYDKTWDSLRTRRTWQDRIIVSIKDGTLRQIDMVISPVLNNAGAMVNFVYFIRDVSREVELERQLLQSQKLEAIGTLAGGIAHDFNNILCAMIGYAELVSHELDPDDRAQESLREVLAAGERARELVAQILTFSRRKETDRKPLAPHLIVQEALRFLRSSIPQTITIEQNVSAKCGYVFADPTQLHQVIVNLCTNAYQAIGAAGGTLRVELVPVHIEHGTLEHAPELAPGDYVRLTVSDTGCGMDPSTRQRVFEPFFTTRDTGTGLGLSTAHGIVSALGGAIRIASTPGRGSTFSVYLPRMPGKAAAKEEEATEPLPTGSGQRIVVVDDEPPVLRLVERSLKSLGYLPLPFSSPSEALAAIERDPSAFDVVLTDQIMPGMTGAELAERVRAVRPDMPILLMTGFRVTLTKQQISAVGIRRCILKPLRTRDLAAAVREALAS